MTSHDAAALTWIARLSLAIGIGAAIACGSFGFKTLRFMSESMQAEGTVVDWIQGQGTAGRSPEPGAYYRVIEIVTPDGERIRVGRSKCERARLSMWRTGRLEASANTSIWPQ